MKPWYKSKTLFWNVLVLVVAIASGFGFAEYQSDLPVEAIAGGVIAVVNLILRAITKEKITILPV